MSCISNMFTIIQYYRFLLGGHNEEIYFAARILANFIPSDQTIILGRSCKNDC